MTSIVEDIKQNFREGTTLTKLIYLNVGVFLCLELLKVFGFLFQQSLMGTIYQNLSFPADVHTLMKKPWSLLSYMFVHQDFFHLFFNLIWLYFGGKLFLSIFGNKKLVGVYILGGICGGIMYMAAYHFFPVFTHQIANAQVIGASAAVLAIVLAISTKSPNYVVRMIFLGEIKLKYIAIACVLLDILSIPKNNAGGHIAHLGGAFFGYFYTFQLHRGRDLTKWINLILDSCYTFFKKKPKLKQVHKRSKTDEQFAREKLQRQAQIDKILDKIAKSGYDGLTKEEKEILFQASKK